MKYIYNPVTQTLDETAKIGEKIESTTPTQPRTDSFNNKPNPQVTANLADPNRTSLSSSDIVLASFNPKEALEFTGGYDKEKINLLKEVKDKARKQKDINNKKPITSLDYINRMQHRYGEAELNESNKMKDAALAAANKPIKDFVTDTLNKYEDDPVETRSRQTVATISTANKILNDQVKKGNIKKEDLILTANPTGLLTNKNKTIAMRDSFMAKQFNKALGVNEEPTNVQRFEKNFKNINSQKPIIKKPIKRTRPIEPVKINLDDYRPFVEPPQIEENSRFKVMEARFKELERKNQQEKIRNKSSGLAALIGERNFD